MKGTEKRGLEPLVAGITNPVIVAAHELKSPLSLLRQLAFSLEDESLTAGERTEIAHHMRLVSERGLRLTSDLTKVQRLEDALFELEPVNPVQLCEEVIYEVSPLYKACGRTVRLSRRSRPALAVAHRDLLRRVLLNFADNALHYGDAQSPVELSVSARGAGEVIRVGVRDFGPAIPADIWKSLEDNLFRPQPLHLRPQSSGLGLTIARRFAEKMNGTVGATRHRDGATFYVDIQASRQLSLL